MHVHPFVGLCRTGAALLSDMQARLERQTDTNILNRKASFQLVPWFNWSPKLGKYEYKGPCMCYDREGRLHQTVPDANKPLGFKDQDACEKKIESFHKCVLAIMRVGYIKRHKMQTVRVQGPRCVQKRYIELSQVRAPS